VTYDENDEAVYEYHLKDHLGNVRMAFADKDGDGYIEPFNVNPNEPNSGGGDGAAWNLTDTEILQESHYYPFGMAMDGDWQNIVNGPENNYLYNGKERNSDFGLDWSDYGARYYDAAIGRWGQVDPMAELMASYSPYTYTFNNPIKYNDPSGMVPEDIIGSVGPANPKPRKLKLRYGIRRVLPWYWGNGGRNRLIDKLQCTVCLNGKSIFKANKPPRASILEITSYSRSTQNLGSGTVRKQNVVTRMSFDTDGNEISIKFQFYSARDRMQIIDASGNTLYDSGFIQGSGGTENNPLRFLDVGRIRMTITPGPDSGTLYKFKARGSRPKYKKVVKRRLWGIIPLWRQKVKKIVSNRGKRTKKWVR
jgi:RHS repeat-associated protein